MAAGLQDVVDEVMLHSSLVCLIITSQSEHSLHPSLTEVHGSHFIQGFVNIQSPDQVGTHPHPYVHTQAQVHTHKVEKKPTDNVIVCRPRGLRSCAI